MNHTNLTLKFSRQKNGIMQKGIIKHKKFLKKKYHFNDPHTTRNGPLLLSKNILKFIENKLLNLFILFS